MNCNIFYTSKKESISQANNIEEKGIGPGTGIESSSIDF